MVRRGEQVEALVTITGPHGLGDVAVGLVCTEYYDFEQTRTDKDGAHTSRETAEATAHETWQPVESTPGIQSIRLTIPPEAPFSYKGDCLFFKRRSLGRPTADPAVIRVPTGRRSPTRPPPPRAPTCEGRSSSAVSSTTRTATARCS
jgi:hypothetical protein